MTGRFVVLEGGEGSGKSLQSRRLAERLAEESVEVVATFEPGATAAGAEIRELVLHAPPAVSPLAEALLMAADRAQHVIEVVAPALERGAWVVCDRYLPSSLVYQGVVRGIGVDVIHTINEPAVRDAAADLVIVLDASDDVAASRAGGPTDRLEAEGSEFHAAVRGAYRSLAPTFGWQVVDGDGSPDSVAARVWELVVPWVSP